MTSIVTVTFKDDVALVCITNPPVNATSVLVRQGLLDAVQACERQKVNAAILYCAGSTFIAGGDMKEFDAPPALPHLPDVVQAIEDSIVPWVAAMHGTVLGGGFEIAMGCAFRIALSGTKFGMPEVNVGIIPGAGGTQRLPRLIDTKTALEITTSARLISSDELMKCGGLDLIWDGPSPLEAGLKFVKNLPARPTPVSKREAKALSVDQMKTLRSGIAKKAKGQQSPLHCFDAVEIATKFPFSEGQVKERSLHLSLRAGAESIALRHAFFAERAVSKPAAIAGAAPLELQKIVVVGGGLMGAGIAFACLQTGLKVTLLERDAAAAKLGEDRVHALIEGGIKRGKITENKAHDLREKLTPGSDYALAADADLAIEAVFEDLSVKQEVFKQLASVMRPDAILATNTSYIDPEHIMDGITNKSRCIGLHFFSPAHIMKLLEIIRLPQTSASVLATGFALAKRLRKVAVLSGICDGFIGNRILTAYRRQADYLLMDGATPLEIDTAMRAFGFPMGPYELQDLTGLQISWANRKRQATTRPNEERYVRLGDFLCEADRLGQRSGAGWYTYSHDSKTPAPDPVVTQLIMDESSTAGIDRQVFSQEEIQSRIVAIIVNEGARIVEEGIAERALDVDMVMIHGYGFPRWRGGPMHYADQIGLNKLKSDMNKVAAQSPKSWIISEMLA